MPSIIWSGKALNDLQRLHKYLEVRNADAARRAIQTIRRGVVSLESSPQSGRATPRAGRNIREWIISFGDTGYVVRYENFGGKVIILRVRHQREL